MNSNLQLVIPHHQQGDSNRSVLFVSELPENITESDLEVFFQEYKDQIVVIQINRKPYESYAPRSQQATVIFKDSKIADEARKALNLKKLRGKTIRVVWHERNNTQRYNNEANLFVKNIPVEVTPREFYEKFLSYGDIISAKLCEDEDGNSLGYAYVSYYDSSSCDKAIVELDDKDFWGNKLEVKRFQKKNERMNNLTTNKNLYIKDLPSTFTDSDLKGLFSTFGTIAWAKVLDDKSGRKFAILSFDNEDSTLKAIEKMKGFKIGEHEIFVDTLMKKSDRQKLLFNRINESNSKLNSMYRNCNLHIRNLPEEFDEKQLEELFAKYGEIKSVKVPKFILETKVNNEKKEYLMSKGFGYVCFTDPENAKAALDDMNNKFIPGHEDAKRPLLIDYFMPKTERKQVMLRSQQPKSHLPFITPIAGGMHMHPTMGRQFKQPTIQPSYPKEPKFIQNVQPVRTDDPNIKILESFEDESGKKDYLGEFIFKKIENHPFAQIHNFTIDTIGKITGMILGIDDINEIFHITTNHESLTNRIQEALALLDQNN
jgi:polyadenylate-binding protein